jgi:hypothetical protein
MGVRKDDRALKTELEAVMDRKQADIRGILGAYGIPLVQSGPKQNASD